MPKTELYVCCHRSYPVPEHPLLRPIQVGAALADARIPGWLHDDEGMNISRLNRSYCELTAQYWAWKNSTAERLGFFHYRRYLYPDPAASAPYILRGRPTNGLLAGLGYDGFERMIGQYDLIVPKGEDMRLSVREHYRRGLDHRGEDLALMERIIADQQPDYRQAMEEYLSGTVCYFGNMYIMRREVFDRYCAWLFPLLAEFDRRAEWGGRSPGQMRVDGYLAERLFGIYLSKHRAQQPVLELPRVHFEENVRLRWRRKLVNFLLPPGSGRRHFVKEKRAGIRKPSEEMK